MNTSRTSNSMDLLNGFLPPELRNAVLGILGTNGQPRRRAEIAYTLIQSHNRIDIHMEMPGFSKDSVDIDFYNNKLIISGHKPSPVLLDDEKIVKTTVKHGLFRESVTLPVSVTNRENVTVKYENGILRIVIDLVREERNRFKINLGENSNPTEEETINRLD